MDASFPILFNLCNDVRTENVKVKSRKSISQSASQAVKQIKCYPDAGSIHKGLFLYKESNAVR